MPLILALVVGIVLSAAGYTMLQKQVRSATVTKTVITAKSDVEAYSVIDSSNLIEKEVPAAVVDENTVTKIEQVTGNICTTPIYAGKPIDLRTIAAKPDDIGDGQQVGVYIDAARCAGVTEGDIVDVYRIGDEMQGEAAPLIAVNCRVMRITDEKGVPVKGASAIIQGVSGDVGLMKNPRIVYLTVKPNEVSQVIQGAVDKTKSCLALAKKSKETEVTVPVDVQAVKTKPVIKNTVKQTEQPGLTESSKGVW